jgi:protein arginine kinase activator
MKCDQCEQEATVHELRVVSGKKVERHLCERCARKQGIAVPTTISVETLIEQYKQAAGKTQGAAPPEKPAAPKVTACPCCSTTYVEFRQTGLLGCPECYAAFEQQLGPLLERAHEGGAQHIGKMPRRALAPADRARPGAQAQTLLGDAAARAARISALRAQLDQAVKSEQYERAATLRDELRRITELHAPHSPPHA